MHVSMRMHKHTCTQKIACVSPWYRMPCQQPLTKCTTPKEHQHDYPSVQPSISP